MALTKISTGMLKQDAASSDLNIDAGTLYLDVSNNRVGIANTSPSAPLTVQSDSGASAIHLVGRASDGYSLLAFRNNADNTTLAALFADESSDDLQIHVAGSERMRISSGGKVGIGTSSPSQTLHVNSGNNNDVALFESSDSVAKITFKDNTSSSAINTNNGNMLLNCDLNDEVADSFMAFRVDNDEKMRIEDNGRVGIGTNSPEELLHLTDTGGNAVLKFTRNDTTVTSGNTIGAIHFAHKDTDDAGVAASIVGKATSAFGKVALTFATGNPTTKTERMRLDADGNVLVGKTGVTESIEGVELRADGWLKAIRSGDYAATLRRNDSDGGILELNKDGGTVGSIGSGVGDSSASTLYIADAGNVGIRFDQASVDDIQPCTSTGADRDNAINLGASDNRFKDLYLSNKVHLQYPGNSYYGRIQIDSSTNLIFGAGPNGTERMRIDGSGNLLVGTTSTLRSNKFHASASNFVGGFNVTGGTGEAVAFFSNGTVVGSVSVTGSATTYNTSSDQRLKENIVDAPSASDDIDAIQVRSFDWKADGSHQKYGMVAQELNTVAPDAVSAPEDPEDMMGVDYSKLVPMLVKEIQSLRARVAQLETN